MMNVRHKRRPFSGTAVSDQSGAAAVEVAITMALFLTAVFAVIEFGWFFLHQNTLTAAVRDGIRIGALGSTMQDSQGNDMSRENSIKAAIKERASTVAQMDLSKILIFPIKGDFTDPDDSGVNNAGGAGAFMRVRVIHEHEWLFPLLVERIFGQPSIRMQSEGTYRNENFIGAGS